jgi:hypothetical protein
MNRKALSFGAAAALLLTWALPAAAFPPQCSCTYCKENPDSMCLVGPIFFDCVDWYENYCPVSTSSTAFQASEKAVFPQGGTPCDSPAAVPSEPVE